MKIIIAIIFLLAIGSLAGVLFCGLVAFNSYLHNQSRRSARFVGYLFMFAAAECLFFAAYAALNLDRAHQFWIPFGIVVGLACAWYGRWIIRNVDKDEAY